MCEYEQRKTGREMKAVSRLHDDILSDGESRLSPVTRTGIELVT